MRMNASFRLTPKNVFRSYLEFTRVFEDGVNTSNLRRIFRSPGMYSNDKRDPHYMLWWPETLSPQKTWEGLSLEKGL